MKTWIKLSEGERKYRKPILRVGEFQKQTEGKVFEFTREHLNYFAGAFSRKIPVPLEHTHDPEKNRGWCVGMEVENDVLFGTFELSELVQDPNVYDTSVYIPIEDGRVQPIEHVALTSYPVVDGLGKFEAVACSLMPQKEETGMAINWANLRTTLELSEDLTEENIVDVLTKRFNEMKEEKVALSSEVTALKLSQAPVINIQEIKKKNGQLIKLAKDARKTKIQSLPLSKNAQDKLVEFYCTDDAIAVALSEGDENPLHDSFDAVIEAIEQHENIEMSELTGIQLSDHRKGEKSHLKADAERRAAAMKGN